MQPQPIQPLFRLIHISDLHFGSAWPRPPTADLSETPGLETHDPEVARALATSIRKILLRAESQGFPARIVDTGDLTTFGRAAAFELVRQYLTGTVDGIGLRDPALPTIPGNHDVWGGGLWGLPWPGVVDPQSVRDRYFDDLPMLCLHPGGPNIYLYRLDSTRLEKHTDWQTPLGNTVLARGHVERDQLTRLKELVKNEDPDGARLRIAAIHHPLMYPENAAFPPTHNLIDPANVVRTLTGLNFGIVLSGHQHLGFAGPMPTAQNPPMHTFSVSTTTQRLHTGWRRVGKSFERLRSLLWANPEIRRTTVSGNELRVYDFLPRPPSDSPAQIEVRVTSYVYDTGRYEFVRGTPYSYFVPLAAAP